MPQAFRVTDPWSCGDTQGQGSPNVFTNNLAQARLTDLTAGHGWPPIAITTASTTVFANNLGWARVGDLHAVHCLGPDCHDGTALPGSPNVYADQGNGPPAGVPAPAEMTSVFAILAMSNDDVMDSVSPTIVAVARKESGLPPSQPAATPTQSDTVPPTVPAALPTDCVDIASHDDNFPGSFQLSPNFTLGQLTLTPLFQPNQKVQAQAGLTVQEIVCNLRYLCINILEPYRTAYGSVLINSGFRLIQNNSAVGISDHCKGCAVDIGFPGSLGQSLWWDRAQLLKNQLQYDQYILEYKTGGWYHLAYKKTGNRNQVLSADLNSTARPLYQTGLLKMR